MESSRRILLVDDDEAFRGMVRLALEGFGCEVTEARDGMEAEQLCNAHPFDLVITDLIMPEREGLETIRDVLRRKSGTKVIAMSGGGHVAAENYLRIARKMGVSQVLRKPFTFEALKDAVEAALGRS